MKHTLSWHQEPGNEIDDCHVFKLDNADPVEIDRIAVRFPPGSHHVHIYRSDTSEPDNVFDCWNGIDWLRWHLVLGVQSEEMDWRLPQGLSIPFDARQQLLVQVHWINTSRNPIDRQIDLSFHTLGPSEAQMAQHVGTIFGVNKQTAMQPHQRKVLTQWCPAPDGGKLLAMMGHYHGLGVRYVVDSRSQGEPSGVEIYHALDEQTFAFQTYEPAFEVAPGAGLQFECDYVNTRNIDIGWGADTRTAEHCNMTAYYYPVRDGERSLFCIQEATEVAAILAPEQRIAVGTSPVYTLRFTQAAPADTMVRLASSDPSALVVPASVHVPAGTTSVAVEARALGTATVAVTATLGTQSTSVTTRIGGLVVSELFLGPDGASDQRQWVEISNLTDEPIDLSGYSLGAGQTDYTTTRVQLQLTLPPRGCAVVGGPLLGASQPPYDQIAPFQPSLAGGAMAAGVALFGVTADQITSQTLPFDAVVYGTGPTSLRAPSGEIAPVIAAAPLDGSLVRMAEARWRGEAIPTPRICEAR